MSEAARERYADVHCANYCRIGGKLPKIRLENDATNLESRGRQGNTGSWAKMVADDADGWMIGLFSSERVPIARVQLDSAVLSILL